MEGGKHLYILVVKPLSRHFLKSVSLSTSLSHFSMVRSRSAAKPSTPADAEPENDDKLELISIGSLYNGPWDKKYWSSSRV